jgi:Patatin-like phospholipase
MSVRELIRRHLFTIVSLLAIGVALWMVEQLHNLFELPPWELVPRHYLMMLFFAFLLLLLTAYLILTGWIVLGTGCTKAWPLGKRWWNGVWSEFRCPSVQAAVAPTIPLGLRPRLAAWGCDLFHGASISIQCFRTAVTTARGAFGSVMIVVAAALCFLPPSDRIAGNFDRPAELSAAGLLAAWGVWCICRQQYGRVPIVVMFFRLLVSLCVFNTIGELLWLAAHRWPELVSFRNYSLWAILHTAFCLFVFARIIDVVQLMVVFPLRATLAVGLVALAGTRGSTDVGIARSYATLLPQVANSKNISAPSPEKAAEKSSAASSDVETQLEAVWLRVLKQRLDIGIPGDGPVILVAASGGGSRAALFTALVLDDLTRKPVGSYDPGKHTLMVSAVSGGTLASAVYAERLRERKHLEERGLPNNYLLEEVLLRMAEDADRFQKWLPKAKTEAYGERAEEYIRNVWETCSKKEAQSFLKSVVIDDMSLDFMAPLLRGTLLPGVERGEAVQRFWERHFGLGRTNLQHLGEDPKFSQHVPLLICNATEILNGDLLLIDFPPLPSDLFAGRRARRRGFPTEAVVNLGSERESIAEIRLSEAVRMSANFPWGFASARLRFAESRESSVQLIDGGVFDNTGIAALRFVLDRLSEWEDEYRAALDSDESTIDEAESAYKSASTFLEQLRQRGVILIEIDSGKKQEPPSGLSAALPALFDPKTAMENSSYAHAAHDGREHVSRITEILSGKRSAQLQDRLNQIGHRATAAEHLDLPTGKLRLDLFHHLRITCNHEENVMTAWALGPTDNAKVFVRFMIGIQGLRDDLAEAIRNLGVVREYAQLVADVDKPEVKSSAEEFEALVNQGLILSEKGRLIQRVRNNAQAAQRYVFQQAAQRKLDFRRQAVGIEIEPPTPDPRIQKLVIDAGKIPPAMGAENPKSDTKGSRPAAASSAAMQDKSQQVKQFLNNVQNVEGKAIRSYNQSREGLLRKLPDSAPSKSAGTAK